MMLHRIAPIVAGLTMDVENTVPFPIGVESLLGREFTVSQEQLA
jgi:hypothetical protein